MNLTKSWIYEFDYLRTAAILLVLLSHGCGIFGVAKMYPLWNPIISFLGAAGVILFFFTAGFFMSRYTPDTAGSVLRTTWQRIRRLLPLYWIALFTTAILYSANLYQGFWIKNFSVFNVLSNAFFVANFFPGFDIPPFWFISSLILFTLTYLVLRLFCKNILYFAVASVGMFFIFHVLQLSGRIWGVDAFLYLVLGSLVGMMHDAGLVSLDTLDSVPPIISWISGASYAIYLFHLLVFGALVTTFSWLGISRGFPALALALGLTTGIGILIQNAYDLSLKRLQSVRIR